TWNQAKDMWLRRASVVLFTRKVAKSGKFNDLGLTMCDNLIDDGEELVQKGVGWALKDMMHSDKVRILAYVQQLKGRGTPKRIIAYALKNLSSAERAAL
ncbi:MAG: DNA alkylation repair protein, partial [Candidatus Promineifilaceae bacterium]